MTVKWFQGAAFKVLGIGFLAILMQIPLAAVDGLVREREGRATEAKAEIASRWGARQLVGGPVLVVPVVRRVRRDKDWASVEELRFVLPDRLSITAGLAPELRRYGIYESAVYTADVRVEGSFGAADIAALAEAGDVEWDRAELRIPVADVRGIRRISALRFGDRTLDPGPIAGDVAGIAAIGAPATLDPGGPAPSFSFSLTLAGSERFAALPLARRTELAVSSAWPDPGFDGAFLPATRTLRANGFEASWQVLDVNRGLPQSWTERNAAARLLLAQTTDVGGDERAGVAAALAAADFGVTLARPAGTYQRNVRAGKYGILFVALTFVAFFLFEVLRRLRVHPVQYLLVGLALSTFYVVLLALSEQIGFGLAYAAAASAVVVMIGGYAAAVLAARRAGVVLGALLAGIYALLYVLVVSEDYSLLMGALALLAAVAALMYLTRRVDWYAAGAPAIER